MSRSEQKVVQYLNEARAGELSLVRVLQSQIAMTPHGTYRSGLETHLRETRDHVERVQTRLAELGEGGNPLQFLGGVAEKVAGQALALAKTPLDLVRGSGGEEKVLKNAKDACATEALEIATYTAIERLARSVGDDRTAELAVSIRADEEKMFDRILREIPKLTGAVVGADIEDDPSFELVHTGAAEGWLRTAVEQGDVRAAHRLGMLLWERGEVDAAEATLQSATADPEGAYALGRLLWRERNDPHAAVEWLDRAAQADHPAAERDLGIVLREHGDVHGAHYWLSRAAERDGEARQVLAELGAGD
jgi:ferritin-like metal-binding protein YciE